MTEKTIIEIYIGYFDGTWDTNFISVAKESIHSVKEQIAQYMDMYDNWYPNMVFYGLYNPLELDE